MFYKLYILKRLNENLSWMDTFTIKHSPASTSLCFQQ